MMKRGKVEEAAVVSEIGLIGYFISEGDQIIKNEVGGYLLRTKVNFFLLIFSDT
jgi:glutathione synthase